MVISSNCSKIHLITEFIVIFQIIFAPDWQGNRIGSNPGPPGL